MQNKKLAEELNKPIIKNLKNEKCNLSLIDNIWVVDLAEMQLLSKFDERVPFFLCVIDI